MDIANKNPGDSHFSSELNQSTTELENIITKSGQSTSSITLDQISKGVSIYTAGADFYTDSGAADAYVLNAILSFNSPVVYFTGMRVRFVPANTNTGASTINVAGLGVKNIKLTDGTSDPDAEELTAGRIIELFYDGTSMLIVNSAIKTLLDIEKFSGLPLSGVTTSIPGPTFDLNSATLNLERRIRVNQTLAASASNQIILVLNGDVGTRYQIIGTFSALEFTTLNHDQASWDFNGVGNFGGLTQTALSVNNRALISPNHNMHTEVTFNLATVGSDHQLRVSYSGSSDIDNLLADIKIMRMR